jgi:hypothetical protein
VGGEAEHLRRDLRHQEQLDIQGREEDGGGEESLRMCIWQPLGLLTTVKPPALRGRYDFDCRAFDGTTPASRFFRRSFPDLFESVLSQIDELPLPRQRLRHSRQGIEGAGCPA